MIRTEYSSLDLARWRSLVTLTRAKDKRLVEEVKQRIWKKGIGESTCKQLF